MANRRSTGRKIRVGVIGVGRGQSFMHQAPHAGMELVAICDTWKERLEEAGKKLGVATYSDYSKFLSHDMDAVILANYFHEHAPFAIKALEADKHVMSECAACNTMAEGVALCRAVERSKKIYMFAENYPYTAPNIEMTRLYGKGEIGEVLYAEGEYIHPMSPEERARISPGINHWRNRLPATYYCTHALAPLMVATDTMPVKVNSLVVPKPASDKAPYLVKNGDFNSVILCRMDNGAVFRLVQVFLPGHSIWYRFHGTLGLMETTRGPGYWGPGQVRIVHEQMDVKPGGFRENTYQPDFPEWARKAQSAGHGGGDWFTNHFFADAIRTGRQPYLDVYRGVAMSCVGILGWRSALADGAPFEMPDFRKESSRRAFQNDNWTPLGKGSGQPPFITRGKPVYDPKGLALARKIWKSMGYKGQ